MKAAASLVPQRFDRIELRRLERRVEAESDADQGGEDERQGDRLRLHLAPIAMRTPISRVRSVTDTSMMFMMPMPPTSSETPAIDHSR